MGLPTLLLIGLGLVALTIAANLIVCLFDEVRIRSRVLALGNKLIVCAWIPSRNLPAFLAFKRHYEITYLDEDGCSHDATCIVSIAFGLKMADHPEGPDALTELDSRLARLRTILPPPGPK